MKSESYQEMLVSEKIDSGREFSQEKQDLLFQHQAAFNILMDAIDKYKQAVKKSIDPQINYEETVLLLANTIEKLAESLPEYSEEKLLMKEGIMHRLKQMIKFFTVKLVSGMSSIRFLTTDKH